MSARFDPDIFFSLIPSFYRDNLGSDDLRFLETLWDGLVRCVDADYARAYQIAQSVRPADVPVKTLYPWVFHRFLEWKSRKARHQHAVLRMDGNALGRFPFFRFVDLESARVYYAGTRREVNPPWVLSNDPDPFQLYASYFSAAAYPTGIGVARMFGTRLRLQHVDSGALVDDATFASGNEVVVESAAEVLRNRVTGNGVLTGYDAVWFADDFVTASPATVDVAAASITLVHQCLWMFSTYALLGVTGTPGTAGVTLDSPNLDFPTLTWPGGFRKGQIIEVVRFGSAVTIPLVDGPSAFRYREVVDADGSTYQLKRAKADCRGLPVGLVNLVLDIPLYPKAVVVEPSLVRFPRALPPGVRVRIEDPSGSQAFESDGSSMSFALPRPVDPDTTSVFVFSLDLTKVSVTSRRFEFGRPLPSGFVAEVAAPYWFPHDHARWTQTILQAVDHVLLPATRPLALTAGLTMDARYPVKVYVDGVLLPVSAYSFASTVRINKTSGSFAAGQVVDVIYVDAESAQDHVHAMFSAVAADGSAISSVPVSEISDRYPVEVETASGELLPAANTPLQAGRVVQVHPAQAGPVRAFVHGAEVSQHFEAVVPARTDVDESYSGTIDSATAMQDGIDAPTVVVDGDQLSLVRVGSDTRVRSSAAVERAWFKNALVDEHLVQNNLGLAVGVLDGGESTQRYKDVVTALFAAMWSSSSVATLENFACIVLGSAYCPAGVNRGIMRADSGRVRVIETSAGVSSSIPLHATIPDRILGPTVSRLAAVSAFARLLDLSDVPWLPFFAEDFSPTYQPAKRLDARTPVVISGAVDSFDSSTLVLESLLSDFVSAEVWRGDLIKLTITGATDPVYGFVDAVLDAQHLRVRQAPDPALGAGWGELGYGAVTGWGGYIVDAAVTGYRIWTRRTRPVDVHLFLDEMLSAESALVDGESFDVAQTRLAAVLKHHVFALRLDWDATTDQAALGYLKVLLDRVRPAETRAVVYAEVNNGAIVDSFSGAIADHGVQVDRLWPRLFVGASYVGYAFMSETPVETSPEAAMFGPDWWEA